MSALKPRTIIQYLPQENDESRRWEHFKNIFDPLIDLKMGDSLNILSLHNFGGGRNYHKCQNTKITGICHYA